MNQEIIEFIKRDRGQFKKPSERTIFDIGLKGHYENPMSDILSFYLNPREAHSLGDLTLQSLLKTSVNAAARDVRWQTPHDTLCDILNGQLDLSAPPTRETINRIDLVLEGQDWIIAIENKVYHSPNNDFESYVQAIHDYDRRAKRKKVFLILSPYEVKKPDWIWVNTADFIREIERNIAQNTAINTPDKWVYFLQDFCTNLKNVIGGETAVNENEIKKLTEEWGSVKKIHDLYNAVYEFRKIPFRGSSGQGIRIRKGLFFENPQLG